MDSITDATTPLPSTPTTPPLINIPPKDKPGFIKSKKGLLIIVGILVLALGLITVFIYFLNSSKQPTAPTPTTIKPKNEQVAKTYPKFEFSYLPPQSVPETPEIINSYTLKDSFSESEAASISSKLGISDVRKLDDYFMANNNTASNPAYFIFNSKTGSLEYGGINPNIKVNGEAKTGVKNFLAQLGYDADTLECEITYNNAQDKNVKFVECHNSWEALGAPLFNIPGLLNIPTSIPLSSLELGRTYTIWSDPNIINVSTGQNGIIRPNDFSTATVALDPNNTVLSINSNLRFITQKTPTEIISPDQALQLLSDNKGETIALPLQQTAYEWDSIFPPGTVSGKNAEIDSFVLAYVENNPGSPQKTYSPNYIIKGTVLLDSGHRVSYIQSISADINSTQIAENIVRDNLQLQTFTITKTPQNIIQNSPTPTVNRSRPSPTPMPPFDCTEADIYKPEAGHGEYFTQPITLPNGETITIIHVIRSGIGTIDGSPASTIWLKENNITGERIKLIRNQFMQLISGPQDQIEIFWPHHSVQYQHNNKCYLTGATPTIFIYSNSHKEFQITPSFTTTADPILQNYSWSVITDKNGNISVNNKLHKFLYYEFSATDAKFNKQNEGFIVERKNLSKLINSLSIQMNLSSKEANRLYFEFDHAITALKSNSQYLKISLVPKDELEFKLPLKVSPKPEFTNRYHFIIEGTTTSKQSISKPNIPEVKRGDSTLIEIGASALN